jgi:DNA-binding LacI/PurR family transcriptional regulator
MKAPTMRDVAERAGVSVQTVSCVVNSTGAISAETRARVWNVIEQLNYRRDPIARSMRTNTRPIACWSSTLPIRCYRSLPAPWKPPPFAENYKVVLYNVGEDMQRQWNISLRRLRG